MLTTGARLEVEHRYGDRKSGARAGWSLVLVDLVSGDELGVGSDHAFEVLEQQRNARLQRTGGIDLSLHQRPKAARKKKPNADEGPLDRLLLLPPRPPKPTFTMRKLSDLPDLRAAVKAWYGEFSDEGPYDEDVVALVKYLRDVVVEERDLGKTVAVVEWLGWLVEEGEPMLEQNVGEAWRAALRRVEDGVQAAAGERGLGKIAFK